MIAGGVEVRSKSPVFRGRSTQMEVAVVQGLSMGIACRGRINLGESCDRDSRGCSIGVDIGRI